MVKKENSVVKLYRMTSATEYVPAYMSVGYSTPEDAIAGETQWENIISSESYTTISHDAI
jgi:hypothetical protein